MSRVLIVDDDEEVRRLLLQSSGYDTATATDGVEALGQMRQQLPCLVLIGRHGRW
jgi:CheY-like chemotaxis protein